MSCNSLYVTHVTWLNAHATELHQLTSCFDRLLLCRGLHVWCNSIHMRRTSLYVTYVIRLDLYANLSFSAHIAFWLTLPLPRSSRVTRRMHMWRDSYICDETHSNITGLLRVTSESHMLHIKSDMSHGTCVTYNSLYVTSHMNESRYRCHAWMRYVTFEYVVSYTTYLHGTCVTYKEWRDSFICEW